MAEKLLLSVVTPKKEMVVDAEVDQVNIPGFDGDMDNTRQAGSFGPTCSRSAKA